MKHPHIISLVTLFAVIFYQIGTIQSENISKTDDKYTTKYDNIDIERIIQSRRLLVSYTNCLLDKEPCTGDGNELKKHLPEAIETQCVKCSEIQRKQAGKMFSYLMQYHRDLWNQLLDKYDHYGKFRKAYEFDEDYDYND